MQFDLPYFKFLNRIKSNKNIKPVRETGMSKTKGFLYVVNIELSETMFIKLINLIGCVIFTGLSTTSSLLFGVILVRNCYVDNEGISRQINE